MLQRRLTLFAAATLTLLLAFALVMAFNLLGQLKVASSTRRDVEIFEAVADLRVGVRKIQYDVVQVQQFLTDYSVTRGWNGLDDGPAQADKAARDFDIQVESAKTLAHRLGLTSVVSKLDKLRATFPDYYATGRTMSQAYAAQGTQAGNAMMGRFDAAANRLLDAQEEVLQAVGTAGERTKGETIRAAEKAQDMAKSTLFLTGLSSVVLIIAFIGMAIFVARAVLKPLSRITGYLQSETTVRSGDSVPGLGRRDEIGAIATAISAAERQNLAFEAEKKAQEQRLAQERRTAAHKLAEAFERKVGNIIEHVSAAATELQASAQQLTATAQETSAQSLAVSSAAQQAGESLTSVASSAEELGASVEEIARQVDTSAEITRQAVGEAKRAADVVTELNRVAASINEIVDFISGLASQTNLLALNATIESARAGEAGKGFAVVASEVKQLAARTSSATMEVNAKIAQIQVVSRDAVNVIEGISRTIGHVDEAGTAIATAVDQQGAATREIVVAMNQAYAGATEVSSNISGVATAAEHTGDAAAQLSLSSSDLAEQAALLHEEMQSFLASVRAA
ncbi:methyl-accepting chemotaxis protein [Asticcacaulis sp. DXS10W]|uniref:Methyl-accepting chemotaxis protein n=1 Tax=Asticcacaulis currens TaxID=2984210 RepID=A0ABT5IDW1_9CAUL|nr:methyl-accepting chemotaxis protein [Asticcacaulis currens]MDC7694368.1 methyl-accepting chemotaxis protein [Asticcacaulis currens]